MAMLTNKLHEDYCQARAIGKSKSEAYALAQPSAKAPAQSGYRLELDETIIARIEELRQELLSEIKNNFGEYYIIDNLKKTLERYEKIATRKNIDMFTMEANSRLLQTFLSLYMINSKNGQSNSEIIDNLTDDELSKAIKELEKKVK